MYLELGIELGVFQMLNTGYTGTTFLYSFIGPNFWSDFWDGYSGQPYEGDGGGGMDGSNY